MESTRLKIKYQITGEESDKRDMSNSIYSKVCANCSRSPGRSRLSLLMQEALGMMSAGTDHRLLRWHALRGVDWH